MTVWLVLGIALVGIALAKVLQMRRVNARAQVWELREVTDHWGLEGRQFFDPGVSALAVMGWKPKVAHLDDLREGSLRGHAYLVAAESSKPHQLTCTWLVAVRTGPGRQAYCSDFTHGGADADAVAAAAEESSLSISSILVDHGYVVVRCDSFREVPVAAELAVGIAETFASGEPTSLEPPPPPPTGTETWPQVPEPRQG